MAFHIGEGDSSLSFPDDPVDLIWTDPPFGTNKKQSQRGNSYLDVSVEEAVELTCAAVRNVTLKDTSVVCVCADYRIIHDVIVELSNDFIFRGEIIWTFGLGRPRLSWWPVRHNTIATFAVSELAKFDSAAIPLEPRRAPKPGYPDTKPAGSVWDKTLSNTDSERVGYPNQKPLDIIRPFILAHTDPGDLVCDPFMGSGTVGHAALEAGRDFIGQDLNPESVRICETRFKGVGSE